MVHCFVIVVIGSLVNGDIAALPRSLRFCAINNFAILCLFVSGIQWWSSSGFVFSGAWPGPFHFSIFWMPGPWCFPLLFLSYCNFVFVVPSVYTVVVHLRGGFVCLGLIV